jgi:tetratricopeptide (TPR) repeat protein
MSDEAKAHFARGRAQLLDNHLALAIASFEEALAADPAYADALNNLGVAQLMMGKAAEAARSFERAIAIRPDFAFAHANRGNAYIEMKKLPAAISSYERALEAKPDMEFLAGSVAHMKMDIADWVGLEPGSSPCAMPSSAANAPPTRS